jgi:hypothetical protein
MLRGRWVMLRGRWVMLRACLLGDAESSLGDAKSSLGDAKSSLGDAKRSLGDVCVVKDAAAPLLLDLVGTAFDDKRRPPELKQAHVDAGYARVAAGLPPLPAEGEPQWAEASVDGGDAEGTQAAAQLVSSDAQRWLEVFQPDYAKPVSLDTAAVSFGSCSHLRVADYQQVTVRNTGAQKVACFWSAPVDAEGVGPGEAPRAIFSVFPEQADIKAGGSVTFRVAFRPGRNTFYYAQRLECFAFVKALRHFRTAAPRAMTAPWCLVRTPTPPPHAALDCTPRFLCVTSRPLGVEGIALLSLSHSHTLTRSLPHFL